MIAKDCGNDILQEIRNKIHKFEKSEYDQPFVNFIKNFILAQMRNFYENDTNKKGGGVTSTIKRMFHFNNTDVKFVMTKEHIDWISKDIGILWKLLNEKEIADNVKVQAFKVIPEILSDEY